MIDLVAQKEVRKFDISPLRRPHGLAVADGKVYFTAEANRIVGRYDPAANKIDWLTGTGQATTHMVIAGRAPGQLFTANIGGDSITAIEGTAVTTIPVGKGPEALDLSPDGKELWTAHSRDGGVSIIDVAGKKVVATLALGTKRSNRLKFTPDGKRVLITDLDAGDLVVLDAATRKEIQRVKLGKTPEGILMAKDGFARLRVCGGRRPDRHRGLEDVASDRPPGDRQRPGRHGLGGPQIIASVQRCGVSWRERKAEDKRSS